jgi:hypothetical protein
VLTLRPHGEYDFSSGSSVAAAEITGVIALLLSASGTRLDAGTVRTLLGREHAAVDVNGALASLGTEGRTSLAARSAR